MTDAISRRKFVTTVAATGAGLTILPRHVLGRGFQAPSDTLNVATVGINGQGFTNTRNLLSQNIVAICDVDDGLLQGALARFKTQAQQAANPPQQANRQRREPSKPQQEANARRPAQNAAENLRRFVDEGLPKVKTYKDYREMLEKQKDIDGVVVATPDHMHAPIALAAMDAGKHVYVQKPLCWSVQECRQLAEKAKANPKLVTQMGNQGHSTDGARTGQEYLAAGAIGEIREVHVWTNRPLGYWPQGIPRPAPLPPADPNRPLDWRGRGVELRLAAALAGDYPVPAGLDWNLFLGVAPKVDYHPIYHPFNWRGWVDWGQGALGDMGAHLIDHPFWGLNLGMPTSIETISTPFNGASYPAATTTYYEFAARGNMPAAKLTWYDGGFNPPKPEEIGDERLNGEGGVLYIGTKGKMLQNTYGANPRLLPMDRHNSYGPPPESLPRVPHEAHEMNWVNAIKGKDQISCPFSYAAHLTEIMLLGVAALRANAKLAYDGANMKVTNNDAANEFLTRVYRQGYSL